MGLTYEMRNFIEREHSLGGLTGSDAREDWARDIRADFVWHLACAQDELRFELEARQKWPGSATGIEERCRPLRDKIVEIDAWIAESQNRISAKWWIDKRTEFQEIMHQYPRRKPMPRIGALRTPPLSKTETVFS